MKETIYTIPLNDAFHAEDECPFCRLERDAEQHALEFILGKQSSYMEDDIRMETDRMGFCKAHMKMVFDQNNKLGLALAAPLPPRKRLSGATDRHYCFLYRASRRGSMQ